MAYTKTEWSGLPLLSARNLNHLETQHDQFVGDVGSHDHDDNHYPKTEVDARFFHSGNMGVGSGSNPDTLDGDHVSGILTTLLPIGSVMIWSGSEGTIPAGWAICNGQIVGGYTTPDLRDRFVVCAGSSYSPGDSGGDDSFIPTATLNVTDHVLTTAEIPSHTHDYTEYGASQNRDVTPDVTYYAGSPTSTSRTAENQDEGGDQAHGHPGSTITFDSVDSRPPFKALYYIFKYA